MLYNIKFNFDKDYLLKLYKDNTHLLTSYTDPRGTVEEWKIVRVESTPYIEYLKEKFKIKDGRPRFYNLPPYCILPEHTDHNTLCSINVLLNSEEKCAPITILGKDYYYDSALLNTQIKHGVKNGEKERILFKLSIFDQTFDEVKMSIESINT